VRWLFGLLAIGIAACGPWTTRPCLKSDSAATRWVRQGWHDATEPTGSWQTRICATEDVITYGYDDERRDAPACTEEIVDRLESDFFRHSPIANNRLQLARVVGITRMKQLRDYWPEKTRVLRRLAALRPEDIADYESMPGEHGPPLEKEMFRRLALGELANGHLGANYDEAHAAALAQRRGARDAIERRLLEPAVELHFERALSSSTTLFDQILAETKAALDRDYEEVEHGLILDHLQLMARYAKLLGREGLASGFFRTIVDRQARVASVRGRPAARRDLYVAARMAELECHMDREDLVSFSKRWYEAPSRSLDESLFIPALYERGFECRGKTAQELELPTLLDRLAQGTLSTGSTLSKDGTAVLRILPEHPELVTDPAVRAFFLTHSDAFQVLQPYWLHDHLTPVQRVIAASEPGDPQVRALLQGFLRRFAEGPVLRERDLLLVARHAKAFGLESEVRAQADALSAHAVKASSYPGLDTMMAEGIRASLDAATLEPW
jgi:hypothetical protein